MEFRAEKVEQYRNYLAANCEMQNQRAPPTRITNVTNRSHHCESRCIIFFHECTGHALRGACAEPTLIYWTGHVVISSGDVFRYFFIPPVAYPQRKQIGF